MHSNRPHHATVQALCTLAGGLKSAGWSSVLLVLVLGVRGVHAAETNVTHAAESMHEYASWIWDHHTEDFQVCRFWKKFEIPETSRVKNAHLRITADNGYRVFLDGREIGQAGEWQTVISYDVTAILKPGSHVLAIEAFNGTLYAGAILDLSIELQNKAFVHVGTDASWKVVPNDETGWEKRATRQSSWRPATIVQINRWRPRIIDGPVLQPIRLQFWQTPTFQLASLAVSTIVVLLCVYLMAQLAVQRKSQRLLQLERARLARDLHDDLGASITQLILFGEVTQRELPEGTPTRARLDQLCNRMRELAGAISEVVWVVNAHRDTLDDFSEYVCKYAETFLRSARVRCRFDVCAEFPAGAFEMPVRRNLFLAVKEALNNAAKHSGATEVLLRISCDTQFVRVVVEDNGKGFEPARAASERNGLRNMRQRMEDLGGTCLLASRPGRGCRIEFVMPLRAARLRSAWSKRWHFWRRKTAPAPTTAPAAAAGDTAAQTVSI